MRKSRARRDAQKYYEKIAKSLEQDKTLGKTILNIHKVLVRIEKSLKRYRTIPTISRDLEE